MLKKIERKRKIRKRQVTENTNQTAVHQAGLKPKVRGTSLVYPLVTPPPGAPSPPALPPMSSSASPAAPLGFHSRDPRGSRRGSCGTALAWFPL